MFIKRLLVHYFFKLKYIRQNFNFDASCSISYDVHVNTRIGGRGIICVGPNSIVEKGSQLVTYGGTIHIGRNVFIGPQSIIYGHGGVKIGDNVMIAAACIIIPANHNYDDVDHLINTQGERRIGIIIEDNVWIGSNVKVMDGVCISSGTVVASGAVLTRSTVKNGVYMGVPAKLFRIRGE